MLILSSTYAGSLMMFRTLRILLFSCVALFCMTAVLPLQAQELKPEDEAIANDNSVTVYERATLNSRRVKSLRKGDRVAVAYEIERSEGAWCVIIESGQTEISGYVQCSFLDLKENSKKNWQLVGSTAAETDTGSLKVTIAGNQVLVPVKLGYKVKSAEALLLLDTGASMSVISKETANRLGIKPEDTKAALAQVVGGGLIMHALVRLDSITIDYHSKRDLTVGIIEHNGPPVRYDGLLGMDFLRDLKYTIDFRNNVLRWER